MDLFSVTPKTPYNQYTLLNIMTKIAVIKKHFKKFDVYFPYQIHDNERPDTIAHDYYGNSTYAWLIMFANDIYDPYYQWPLTTPQFHDYLQKKYGNIYEQRSVISHYEYTGIGGNLNPQRITYKMSINTYNNSTTDQKLGWVPIYVYDYENRLNEAKREIRLLSNEYIKQVDREISVIFNGR